MSVSDVSSGGRSSSSAIARAMEAADVPGVIHAVTLQIIIDGKLYKHFESFKLQQHTGKHHHFQLVLQNTATGTEQDQSLEDVRIFLGKRISVTFKYKHVFSDSPERLFIGVITQVGLNKQQGGKGSVVLEGFSPTYLLDGAAHTQSFGGNVPVGLNIIANAVLSQGLDANNFQLSVKSNYTGSIAYSCQYNESHYNYLARMAAAYGEWFFYDGVVLHFGKPTLPAPLKLIYGKDTFEVALKMNTRHVDIMHYGYNSNNNTLLTTGQTAISGLGSTTGGFAFEASRQTYKMFSVNVAPIRATTDKDIESTQKADIGARVADAFTIKGKTTIPFLYPGCIVDMNFREPDSSDVKYFSRVLIIEIEHSLDLLGHYIGIYTAIPADTELLPEPEYSMPIAEPQLATVISNLDSYGRVQVAFPWQRGGLTTDFIRMMSPDAGGTDQVMQNRGYVAIPEVGDQVMVGFVHAHPDRPFVMGGMFHGGVGLGGGANNHIKSISTRSGCLIQFDDTDSQGSITIKDPSGNTWYMDGAGNINVTAPKNFIVRAGENIIMTAGMNLDQNVGENMTTNVGNNNKVSIANNHQFSSRNYKQNINENKTINIEGDLNETTSKTTHKAKNGDILIQSAGVAKVLGKIDAKVNKG